MFEKLKNHLKVNKMKQINIEVNAKAIAYVRASEDGKSFTDESRWDRFTEEKNGAVLESHKSGEKQATIKGKVIGYWFGEQGIAFTSSKSWDTFVKAANSGEFEAKPRGRPAVSGTSTKEKTSAKTTKSTKTAKVAAKPVKKTKTETVSEKPARASGRGRISKISDVKKVSKTPATIEGKVVSKTIAKTPSKADAEPILTLDIGEDTSPGDASIIVLKTLKSELKRIGVTSQNVRDLMHMLTGYAKELV